MGARSKRAARCPRCRVHVERCLCAEIPAIALATEVVLVVHRRELARPTATGPLALLALRNSRQLVHGHDDQRLDLRGLHAAGRRVMVLHPTEQARVLDAALAAEDARPVTLVVPDGSWRQASKLARRIPGLDAAEPVTLAPGPPTRYGLRREPKAGGLATMEAIARALGVLESPQVQARLEAVFERMVAATLATRGG